jgi:hypothetical protein
MEEVDEVPRLALLISGEAKAVARQSMEVDEKEERGVVEEQNAAAAEVEEDDEDEQLPPEPQVRRVKPSRASSDDLTRFMEIYVRENGIHASWKWKSHQVAHLSSAAVNFTTPILCTDIELKKKIMSYVREQEIGEADV